VAMVQDVTFSYKMHIYCLTSLHFGNKIMFINLLVEGDFWL